MQELGWDEFCAWAWAQRDLPFAVDAVCVEAERFLAGDRQGGLACWNLEGTLRWSIDVGQRVEGFASGRDGEREMLFATAGLDVLGISINDGEVVWREELEGSSEAVLFDSLGDRVVVTSSVYDIEHHAFIEAACWFFSPCGELLAVERFDERAWHLALHGEGVLMGLGRPRGGVLLGDAGGLKHIELCDSPVSCGHAEAGTSLLGHADGSFTMHGPEGSVTYLSGCSTLTSVLLYEGIALVGDHYGMLAGFRGDELLWSVNLDDEVVGIVASRFENAAAVWACTRRAEGGRLFLLSLEDGERMLRSEAPSRIRCMSSHEGNVLFGLEDGMLLLHEMDMLARRMAEDPPDEGGPDDHRRKMLDRLRRLRG